MPRRMTSSNGSMLSSRCRYRLLLLIIIDGLKYLTAKIAPESPWFLIHGDNFARVKDVFGVQRPFQYSHQLDFRIGSTDR